MKKNTIIFILIGLIIVLLLCACNTPPKLQPYTFEPSLKSPSIQIGEVEMHFDRGFIMPGIRKLLVNISYFPLEDAVCLRYRINSMTYYQFWSADGREAFAKTLEKYKTDYETRSFGNSSRRSKRKYGLSNGYIIWQMSSFTIQAKASTVVDFGYFFVDRRPYFVASQRETTYEDPLSRDNNRYLPEMPIYFTRAQADELAALFSEDFLSTITLTSSAIRSTAVDFDDYD
jgi:hypothetical protein